MDVRSAAQIIRDTVDIETVVSLYGYQPKHGFMVCPFHGDSNASLKLYKGRNHSGWHCFGCGRGGSVIDFVKEHEQCDFRTATKAIDNALHLGLFSDTENPIALERSRKVQKWLDSFVDAVNAYCECLLEGIEKQQKLNLIRLHALEDKIDVDVQSVTPQEWDFIHQFEANDEYDDYRKEKIREFQEEVSAWRRKLRAKARSV